MSLHNINFFLTPEKYQQGGQQEFYNDEELKGMIDYFNDLFSLTTVTLTINSIQFTEIQKCHTLQNLFTKYQMYKYA